MHRFFVETRLDGGEVVLPGHIAHQVTAVLRMRPGAGLVLFDGSGGEWQAELLSVGREGARAQLLSHAVPPGREPSIQVILCQALLKADKVEWILQKGTELGMAAFRPLIMCRTVPVERAATQGRKLARWRRIVVEAAEQSGRCTVPAVYPPVPLEVVLREARATVLCWEDEQTHPFRDAFGRALAEGDGRVQVIIGPEGGITPEEVRAAAKAGVHLASLGPRTLRSETAALAAAALALLGEAHG
ncbi:MAG: 16S rRNA (uracil(1498)-N(3))-methyltransferase [Chloroflexota bacterium]